MIYTRWEYSDRGQLFVQGLFQMNPDGTGQTEFYGNNSWFPTSLLHARGIPGTQKVVAIFSGHHTRQAGKLGIVDPARGRQENAGTQLIAPVRDTPAERIDAYGQDGDLFQYPYPLSESEFVVACAPLGWSRSPTLFKLYWIAADGRRELLAGRSGDLLQSAGAPGGAAEAARCGRVWWTIARPPARASCRISTPARAWRGFPAARVKKLRVIALDVSRGGRRLELQRGSGRRCPGLHAGLHRQRQLGRRRSCWARPPSTPTARPSSRCRPARRSTSRRSTPGGMRCRRCGAG